jgi:hypothetical protein
MKKYPPASLFGYPSFSLVKDRKREWLSIVHIRYKKLFGEPKDIENDLKML